MKRLTLFGVIAGALFLILGFVVIGSASTEVERHEARIIGMLLMSFGAMTAGTTLYIDARRMLAGQRKASAQNDARFRCLVCGSATATMRCQKHMARVCPNCISKHDEPQCFYVPLSRFQKGA